MKLSPSHAHSMSLTNLQRMIDLAERFFATRDDPTQLSINEDSMAMLQKIHPATLGEIADDNGPIAWAIVIPTTSTLMHQFVNKEINERELAVNTPIGEPYDSAYLCSALVLPEHRGKGLAKRLISDGIRGIQKDHIIRQLFYWGFSEEGKRLAESVALAFQLPLYARPVESAVS